MNNKRLPKMSAIWKGKEYEVKSYYWSKFEDFVVLISPLSGQDLTVEVKDLDELK